MAIWQCVSWTMHIGVEVLEAIFTPPESYIVQQWIVPFCKLYWKLLFHKRKTKICASPWVFLLSFWSYSNFSPSFQGYSLQLYFVRFKTIFCGVSEEWEYWAEEMWSTSNRISFHGSSNRESRFNERSVTLKKSHLFFKAAKKSWEYICGLTEMKACSRI